jgi:hypothetical protein
MISIFLRSLDFTGRWQVFRRKRCLMILKGMVIREKTLAIMTFYRNFLYYSHDDRLVIQERIHCCFVIRIWMVEIIEENNLLSGVKNEVIIKNCN